MKQSFQTSCIIIVIIRINIVYFYGNDLVLPAVHQGEGLGRPGQRRGAVTRVVEGRGNEEEGSVDRKSVV